MTARPIMFVLIFIASMMTPFVDTFVGNVIAEDTVVCCDSAEVNLHLLGSASAGTMSPFSQDLADTTTTATIANAITSEETVGKWVLPNVWPGTIPAESWKVSIQYELSDAASAQVNATASLKIGSQTFSTSTSPGSSFLAQGTGTLTFDIDVDATSISNNGVIELTLTARSVVFSLPMGDAMLEFMWGSEESDSTIEAEIPLFDLTLLEPEVEGSEVYFSVVIDSNWGMDILSKTESIEMLVGNTIITGDPIETALGDGVRVTWTWEGAAGGIETVSVETRLTIEIGSASLSGSASFEIETFDSTGGTGTYYPPEEPLKTTGAGSPLSITGTFSLQSSESGLQLERETRVEIGGEMAFWMRWGMDHLGDEVTPLTPVLKSFDAGSVSDEERVSRSIEDIEVNEFERQMSSSGLGTYYLGVGLGFEVADLLGEQIDKFDTISIVVDLNGEPNVVNHPIALIISTTKIIDNGERRALLEDFITPQPSPLWSEYSLLLSGKTSAMTSFAGATMEPSESVTMSHSRLPWGESLEVKGDSIGQDDNFKFTATPTKDPIHSPLPLLLLVLFGLGFGFMMALKLTKNRQRKILYVEIVLVPLVAFIHFFGYQPPFVGGAVATVVVLWWVTAVTSPRSRAELVQEAIALTTPVIPCPSCSTPNPVTSQERPLRFACVGCERVIKIIA
ncbi:MAG: hypothetical protein HOL22_07980 [Euryarchaeota archaeon]|jgi:hypothetical protein|nr:hypothetical protein [Euryarchaeota archaeon]MBT5595057.1 hypothetical protein [Euryarchaeota archaeon]MBT5843533.1 hypothetical protein [Euryarchaeota archaeon]MBT6641439.1 hypothetical protein [Euryarchaeota archaeon]MBT6844399.1 hypothetical protein [Euryarchaeota archaeon]